MIVYLIKRLATAIVVVLGIMAVTFTMLHVIAPSPAKATLGIKATPQAIADFNRQNGYDKPLVVQYLTYINHTIHLNFGYSYKANQNVSALFNENSARSAYLTLVSLVLAIAIAIPLGIWQGIKRNSVVDYVATGASFTFYSMPLFFLSLLLIAVFSFSLGWFPSEASQANTTLGVIADPRAMVLPIASLVVVSVASFSRYMRSSTLDNLAQDYIKVARAKGLSERAVLTRHLLRNCCLPLVTLVGLSIPDLLAGNVVTEQVFNFHGLGLLFYNSLGTEDYPVLLAYTLVGGILVVIGNLVADVTLTVADPRIRLT